MARFGTAMLVALTVSACGGAGGDGTTVLLSEPFGTPAGGAVDLTSKWIVTSGAVCTASHTDVDVPGAPPQGNPTYGLVLKCSGDITSVAQYSSLRTIDTYVLDKPMTFAFDARTDSAASAGIDPQPGMDVTLEPINGGLFVSKVTLRSDTATYAFKTAVNYWFQVTHTYPADGRFHRYTFVVDGAGGAEWRRDGALQANTTTMPPNLGNQYFKVRAPPSSALVPGEGHFDNVTISTP